MPDDRENPIDPPDNQGGGNAVTDVTGDTVSSMDSASSSTTEEAAPIDPPDNQGGGN